MLPISSPIILPITYWILGFMLWLIVTAAVCLIKRNNGLVDIFWGLGFVILTGVSFFAQETHSIFSTVMTGLVFLWGIRLSIYLALRNWNKPEDFRYANWRKGWGKHWVLFSILKVYLLQGLIMQVIAIPIFITLVVAPQEVQVLSMREATLLFLAMTIALVGIITESVADAQKSKFKKTASSPTEICQVGLWKFSRHPNYLGEILTWIGLGLLPISLPFGILGLVSPAMLIFLLYKVSGVPMLEERMKGRPDFEEYKRKTGAIFPTWLS